MCMTRNVFNIKRNRSENYEKEKRNREQEKEKKKRDTGKCENMIGGTDHGHKKFTRGRKANGWKITRLFSRVQLNSSIEKS